MFFTHNYVSLLLGAQWSHLQVLHVFVIVGDSCVPGVRSNAIYCEVPQCDVLPQF